LAREQDQQLSKEELQEIAEKLEDVVENYNQAIAQTEDAPARKQLRRQQRKMPKQLVKQVRSWIERKQKYEKDMEILEQRNSYSKTDHDATFMRMKDDYMKNGQLKPGYNVKIATEGQYTLAYGLFPNLTDIKTLIPFLEAIKDHYFELPEHIVADAGYGSEQNYAHILMKTKRTSLLTYAHYLNEQKRSYKTDSFRTSNWAYDEEQDAYTCPNDKKLFFQRHTARKDRSGFTRTFKAYACEDCTGCPFRSTCTKAQEGTNRTLMINETWEQEKAYVREKLSEEKTSKLYRQRKMDVEPVFAFLKANLGFTRFMLRGKYKAEHDIGLALMAVNLRKYAVRR